jgi:hypothetical protein
MSSFERLGLFFTIFLLASLISLPLVLMHGSALKARLQKLPKGVVLSILTTVLLLSSVLALYYHLSVPRFI